MPSTYSTRLKVTKQGTGDNSGTWGTVANDQTFELLDEAIAGVTTVNCTTGSNYTLSVANGATSESRKMVLKLSGTPINAISIIVPSVEKTYDVDATNLSGSYAVTVKASTGTGVDFTAGTKGRVYFDGTNVISLNPPVQVTLTMPSEFTVTGSGTSTLAVTKSSSTSANTFYAGPNGSTGTATFRAIDTADLPSATTTTSGIVRLATAAESQTGTSTSLPPALATILNHPGVAKAWVVFDGTGSTGSKTIKSAYNVSSVNKTSSGSFTITHNAFATSDFVVVGSAGDLAAPSNACSTTVRVHDRTTTTTKITTVSNCMTEGYWDGDNVHVVFYGNLL